MTSVSHRCAPHNLCWSVKKRKKRKQLYTQSILLLPWAFSPGEQLNYKDRAGARRQQWNKTSYFSFFAVIFWWDEEKKNWDSESFSFSFCWCSFTTGFYYQSLWAGHWWKSERTTIIPMKKLFGIQSLKNTDVFCCFNPKDSFRFWTQNIWRLLEANAH